jgi:hypothetical protein
VGLSKILGFGVPIGKYPWDILSGRPGYKELLCLLPKIPSGISSQAIDFPFFKGVSCYYKK